MKRTHKEKKLDKKFITNNPKYRKKKLVRETNSREYKNSGISDQQVKSSLQKLLRGSKLNFSALYLSLLETEQTNLSRMENVPPKHCTNSSECQN